MWTYHVVLGDLYDPQGAKCATGYSGVPTARNDVTQEAIANVGPLPRGQYQMGPAYDSPHTGPLTMALTQIMGDSFGRDNFRIHGDNVNHDASHGCIILDRPTRKTLAVSSDRDLLVIA